MKKWTQKEIDFLKNNTDKTDKQLGVLLEKTENSIAHKRLRLGIKKNFNLPMTEVIQEYQSGKGYLTIGKKHGCSAETVRTWMAKTDIPLRRKKKLSTDKIVKEFKSGKNGVQVAAIFNCGSSAVYKHLEKSGIKASEYNVVELPEQQIVSDYKDGKSIIKLASELDASGKRIRQVLVDNDIDIRPFTPTLQPPLSRSKLPTAKIVEEFKSGKSVVEIAKSFNCSGKTVYKHLEVNGIIASEYNIVSLPEQQIICDYQVGKGITTLASEFDVSNGRIRNVLTDNNIAIRPPWQYSLFTIPTAELTEEQFQIIEGCLLSDGGVYRNGITSYFSLYSIHREFAVHLIETLPLSNWRIYFSKSRKKILAGRECNIKEAYRIASCNDKSLTAFRERWYPNDKKIVPKDIILSPIVVKYWFYGDGSTSFASRGKGVSTKFCTQGFTVADCEFLVSKLKDIGLRFNVGMDNRKQPNIVSGRADTILGLLDYIGEPNMSCFSYKWKRPKKKVMIG